MCRKAKAEISEGTSIAEIDGVIDRLSRELTCLIDLRVLASAEQAAFSAILRDLWTLAVRVRRSEDPEAVDRRRSSAYRREMSRMIGVLAADLDIAYQRLGYAA